MRFQTFNCPMCGAPAREDASKCQHCGARLATVACPSCFAMMFAGAKHCSRCGAPAVRTELEGAAERNCPRCRTGMNLVQVGNTAMRECPRCDGLWIDAAAFEKLCAEREQQAAVLGTAKAAPAPRPGKVEPIRYVPCPECGKLMHRVNFARCSGVVVDVCKAHGTWFDRDELMHIVEFIRSGGLDRAREERMAELAAEERRLQRARQPGELSGPDWTLDERAAGIRATRDLLRLFLSGGGSRRIGG